MPTDNQSGQGTQKSGEQPNPERNEFNDKPGQQRDQSKQGQQHDPHKSQSGKHDGEMGEQNRPGEKRDR